MKDLIPEFNPLKHSTNEWINKVDDLAAAYNWPKNLTAHIVLLKMIGAAKVWYNGLKSLN